MHIDQNCKFVLSIGNRDIETIKHIFYFVHQNFANAATNAHI